MPREVYLSVEEAIKNLNLMSFVMSALLLLTILVAISFPELVSSSAEFVFATTDNEDGGEGDGGDGDGGGGEQQGDDDQQVGSH